MIVYSVIMRKGEKLVECYAPGEAVGQTAYGERGKKDAVFFFFSLVKSVNCHAACRAHRL
jgi:hypothetical protein